MSDVFYRVVREVGRTAFVFSSRPLVLGAQHVARPGAFILACTHTSPYDVPLLMRHVPRHLDFVSSTEVFAQPLVGWFYRNLNAFPLDRSRPDAPTVRTILRRLQRGRVVAIFPEGGFRTGTASVIHSAKIRPGFGKLAALTRAPIVPAVVINSATYARVARWLPTFSARYGVAFGPAIEPDATPAVNEGRLLDALRELHAQLATRLGHGIEVVR
jgi:1-acyl-sn-glycerol-3-phosphate acyltransferase